MATANLTMSLVSANPSGWGIDTGYKCFKFTLPNNLNRLDISNFTFRISRTSVYKSDPMTFDFWVLEAAQTATPTTPSVQISVNTAQSSSKTYAADLTNKLNALSGTVRDFYVYLKISSSTNYCNFNSSSLNASTITYEVINREYAPKISSGSAARSAPSDSKINITAKAIVSNNATMISGETYNSYVRFNLYIKGVYSRYVDYVFPNGSTGSRSNVEVSSTFYNVAYYSGNTYTVTAEYIINWTYDSSSGTVTSGEMLVGTINPESIPFMISKNNMGVAIGQYSSQTGDETSGLFECGWDAKFYGAILDANGNPIGGSSLIKIVKPETVIGTYNDGSSDHNIYRVVFTTSGITTSTGAQTISLASVISGSITRLLSLNGSCHLTGSGLVGWLPLNTYHNSNVRSFARVQANSIVCYCTAANNSTMFILEYLKD